VNKLILTTLGLIIAVGFVLGCGSGEDEATSADKQASAPPTKAQFIEQADMVCKKTAKARLIEIASWKAQYPGGAEKAEADLDAGLKEVIAPSIQRKVKELEGLTPPKGDEAKVSHMIGILSKASETLAKEGEKGLPHSGIAEYEHDAKAYGLTACSIP
jgi:hypothetical protein